MHELESEIRILREQLEQLEAQLDQLETGDSGGCAILVKTATISVYPTTAVAYYAVTPQVPGGTESEGSTPAITALTGHFLVANVGSAIPPSGTSLLAIPCGGRYIVRYD